MNYKEYSNEEILDRINTILSEDEYSNFSLAYVLKVKDECQNCYAVAMNGDKIIGFNPFENEIDNLPDWDFNTDNNIFEELEWNREIIYMSMECHYGIWTEVLNYYPYDIEHTDGMQNYLSYCRAKNISQELIKEIIGKDVADIMKYSRDYIKEKDGIIEMSMDKFRNEKEVQYLSFVLGYDLMNEKLKHSEKNECDNVYGFCNYIVRKFIETYNYKHEKKPTYDILQEWLDNNKEIIQSEYLCYFNLDDKCILETGTRNNEKVALIERTTEYGKEYIVAFNYKVNDKKVEWGYGYYYDSNYIKAKDDFEKVKAGGNLADTFDVKKNKNHKERER